MKQYGLIGYPLGHSASAAYFGNKFEQQAIDACYDLYEIENIEHVENLRDSLSGFNVTIPYKKAILPYLSSISDEAKMVGAVNCVKVDDKGAFHGYNTDVVGIRASLAHCDLKGKTAIVLGTGGAAAAVVAVLKELDMEIISVSRRPAEGVVTYQDLTDELITRCSLIVNATPVGMYPHIEECPPLPYNAITSKHILFDLIYNPEQTMFLKNGMTQGAKTISGIEMFCCQAEASWAIWNK